MLAASETMCHTIPKTGLQTLLDILKQSYQCVGPVVSEHSLVYSSISKLSQLPLGYSDQQQPGEYRLNFDPQSSDYFSITTGAQGVKPWLFKPEEKLWSVNKHDGQIQFNTALTEQKPLAIIGLRACDLSALKLQEFVDPYYAAHRENLFIVAVNCHRAVDTCFCASTGDGPEIKEAYDVLLTELEQVFVIQSGTDTGREVLEILAGDVQLKKLTQEQEQEKQQRLDKATEQSRKLPDRPVAQS